MKVAFIGPDMTGKSNIAAALSELTSLPVFKNSREWETKLASEEYFLNLLRFGGPFLMDFMLQTQVSVILDRFYPCELAYAKAFGRETDMQAIEWMDEKFSEAEGKFILCLKKDYSTLIDDVYPDQLSGKKLKEIEKHYLDFLDMTKCDYLVLYTDDEDLQGQISKITRFLDEHL